MGGKHALVHLKFGSLVWATFTSPQRVGRRGQAIFTSISVCVKGEGSWAVTWCDGGQRKL